MKRILKAGATSQTIDIFIGNSSSTTGAGLTGLVYNSAGLTCYYRVGATGAATALTLATQTVAGAWTQGGFVEISSGNMPGHYRLDLANATVASVGAATLALKGATNMAPCNVELQMVTNDFEAGVVASVSGAVGSVTGNVGGNVTGAVLGGMTGNITGNLSGSIGSVASGGITAASLATDAIDADALAADAIAEINATVDTAIADAALATAANLATVAGYLDTEIAAILADTNELQTDLSNGGRLDLLVDAIKAKTDNLPSDPAGWSDISAAFTALNDLDAAGIRSAVGLASANLDTQLADLPTNAELTTALGTADDATLAAIAALNDLSAADVNAEIDTALADIHLDHLLAVAYDPASKPGAADALLNELVESDAGVSRFTANALEQAPSGGGGVADWTADERTALRSILGIPASGTTPDDPSTGILDTIRDGIVAANTTLHTAVADIPTNSEFNARTLVAADYATASNLAAANTSISNANTTLLAAIDDIPTNSEFNARTLASADYATAANLSAANTSISNANSTILTAIDDVPTNSEFNARTLASADYATSANLAAANTSIGNANTSILAAVADVPTNAEFEARTLLAADYATAANLTLANTSIANANSTLHTAIADVPTVAEFNARTLATADYATAANLALANTSISSANTTLHSAISGANSSVSSANTTLHSAISGANTSVASANTTLHAAITGIESGGANATAIADAVWDEALSGHTTAGTAGQLLGNLTLTAIADSVWDETTSGHSTAGTTGKALSDAGSAGDPWETAIGNGSAYAEGQAGQLLSKLRTEVANATVIILPGDPIDDDLCHLYGQLVLPSGRLASAISLKLELGASTPIKLDSGRPVAHREVIARTDTDGYIISTAANGTIVQYQPIARTDKLSVGNASWSITSDALIFAQESFYANGTTLDIATLI